jgi:hypothetical protein
MAKSVEELASQFEKMMQQFNGFQSMMQSSLDSLNAMGAWQVTADEAFGELRRQADGASSALQAVTKQVDLAATRMNSLEARIEKATAGPTFVHPHPGSRSVDLNLAPGTSPCSPARDGERPKGHGDDCGGILGPRPQYFNKGTFVTPRPSPVIPVEDEMPVHCRSPPFPKMEFPKFDGESPRLWRDQCEVFFEVYAVHPSLKTRFATLNFKGMAASWLQTVQRQGRITDWDKLCDLVMGKFDRNQY